MPENQQQSTFAPFLLSTPQHSVRAHGAMQQVDATEALAVARQRGSGVVGLVPFHPDRPAQLMVPEHLEISAPLAGKETQLPQPDSVEGIDNPDFRAAVAAAVARMNDGELDKVVLSRLLCAHYGQGAPAPREIFNNLLVQQPRAYVFSAKLPGSDSYLMGASPELVFSTENSEFTTFPLAGTAAREAEIGSTDDAQIGEELMRSPKDRAEHSTVVDDIRTRLLPLCEDIAVPAVPQLVATPQLWHLGTKITGRLSEGLSSLDGARAIHPTPAICGFPGDRALKLIEELEDFDRGFFGGLVGWMDSRGNGEWALVLRCAEISSTTATLFAGAGIIAASTPAGEHAETGNKFGSFGKALGITTR
ncbi:isochorismate synthase [Rothia aerolata]|uniref:isochorismate synthase n=1 Tax=Rothia aerolata TaxID=1812262 RepID=A0A917IS14_9MICC|nr:isochorismate synthase [Rothia aerolata]GGH61559.1 isochorismate synthase [Rothia aerolata]